MYLLANQRTALYLSTNQKLVLPEQRAKEGEEEDEGQQWCIQVHGQGLEPIRGQYCIVYLNQSEVSIVSLRLDRERSSLSTWKLDR